MVAILSYLCFFILRRMYYKMHKSAIAKALPLLFFVLSLPACGGGLAPLPETCEGTDQDLDGVVDETAYCGAPPHGESACVSGACTFTCLAGRADCDGDAQNGCEADTLLDVTTCGGCTPCEDGAACSEGVCVPLEGVVFGGGGHQSVRGIVARANGDLSVFGETFDVLAFPMSSSVVADQRVFVHTFAPDLSARETSLATATDSLGTSASVTVTSASSIPTADGGGLYVAGHFEDSLVWGSCSTTGHATRARPFVARLTAQGVCSWLAQPTATTNPNVYGVTLSSIATTSTGAVFVGTWGIQGGGASSYINVVSGSGSSGNPFGFPSNVVVSEVAPFGSIYMTGGSFSGPYMFGTSSYTGGEPGSAMIASFLDNLQPFQLFRFNYNLDAREHVTDLIPDAHLYAFFNGEGLGTVAYIGEDPWHVDLTGFAPEAIARHDGSVYAVGVVGDDPITIQGDAGSRLLELGATTKDALVALRIRESDGRLQWAGRFALGDLRAVGLAVGGDGRIFIAASSTGFVEVVTNLAKGAGDVAVLVLDPTTLPE